MLSRQTEESVGTLFRVALVPFCRFSRINCVRAVDSSASSITTVLHTAIPRSLYPQGHVSFLPQLVGAVAVILSMLPVALNQVLNFACVEYKVEYGEGYVCFRLILTNPDYWRDEDSEGFGKAVRVGTVAASAALLIGGIGWVFLMSAICFPLDPPKIRSIFIAFVVACICSLLSLVALNFNVCKLVTDDDLNCSKQDTHFAAGANMEILAAVFYVAALYPLFQYSEYAKKAARAAVEHTQDKTQTEKEPFLVQMNHTSPQHGGSASLQTSNHGDEIVASVLKPTANAKLGLSLRDSSKSGVVVKGIAPDSALAMTPLKTDMVLLRINDDPIESVEQAYILLHVSEV